MKYLFVFTVSLLSICSCLSTFEIIPPPREKPKLETLLTPGFKNHWMNKVKSKYSYPRKLQEKGITGWVAVKFNILEDGSVSEPTVIDSSPPNVFDDYAVRAVSFGRYKYIGPSESPVKAIGNVVIVTYGLIKK